MKYTIKSVKKRPWWGRLGINHWDVVVEREDGINLSFTAWGGTVSGFSYEKLEHDIERTLEDYEKPEDGSFLLGKIILVGGERPE